MTGLTTSENDRAAVPEPRADFEIVEVPDRIAARWRRVPADPGTLQPARAEARCRVRPRRIHPRVRRALRQLGQEPLGPGTTSLARLASIAALSPSRFMHVFTDSIGLPLRPYILWLRVRRATAALAAGRTITEAAHLAGSADASHLTRTFRRMLGATARQFTRRSPTAPELPPDAKPRPPARSRHAVANRGYQDAIQRSLSERERC